MRGLGVWIALLGFGLAAAADDPPLLTPASRARAERLSAWRASIETATQAAAAGDVEGAAKLYRDVLEATAAGGEGALLRARAADGLGDLLRSSGAPGDAIRWHEEAAELWKRLLGPAQPRVAVTLHNLGAARLAAGDTGGAVEAFGEAVAVWKAAGREATPEAGASARALEQARARLEPA